MEESMYGDDLVMPTPSADVSPNSTPVPAPKPNRSKEGKPSGSGSQGPTLPKKEAAPPAAPESTAQPAPTLADAVSAGIELFHAGSEFAKCLPFGDRKIRVVITGAIAAVSVLFGGESEVKE